MMWEAIPVLAAAGYSVFTDVRERKIKNYVTFPMMAAGLIYNVIVSGLKGLVFSLVGMLVIGALTAVMAMMKGFGMGDVKLFMGIGAITGWRFAVTVFVYSIFSSVIVSFLISPKAFIKGIRNLIDMFKYVICFRSAPDFEIEASAKTIAFAVHILVGILCAYLIGGAWIWKLF
jgi:prepilin peptidase CpaA